jgi:hypothetical protein
MTEIKRISLSQALKNLTGGDTAEDAVAERRCLKPPIGCGLPLGEPQPFRDGASMREYRITGLCQTCQDTVEEATRRDD